MIFRILALFFCLTATFFAENSEKQVYVIPLQGQIDQAQFYIFRRAFQEATRAKADAVVIRMDTPGGRLLETEEMIGWMRGFDGKVISYVEKHGQSAGAILCLASDEVYMAPGSRVGSAAPILIGATGDVEKTPDALKEKIMSDTRALVRGLAQENGYPEDLAMAFVDQEIEYKLDGKVICKKGELLNLTAKDAIELVDKDGKKVFAQAICADLNSLLDAAGMKGATLKQYEVSNAEKLAKWITMLAPIFLIIGGLGVFIEIKTPGFGIPGIVGGIFLALFFFGHHVAGLAGYEEVVLLLAGIILLALEIFVIPGFGVAGISGIILITAGIVMAMVPALPTLNDDSMDVIKSSYLTLALTRFAISGIILFVVGIILARILPKTSFYNRMVLNHSCDKEEGFVAHDKQKDQQLLGKCGVTTTALRPTGVATIDDRRVDVVSRGDWLPAQTKVIVVAVEGMKITVEPVVETEIQPPIAGPVV